MTAGFSRAAGLALVLAIATVATVDAPAPNAQSATGAVDDAAVVARLRPEQRAFLMVAERDGSRRTVAVADTVAVAPADVPATTAVPAKPTASPIPPTPSPTPRPTASPRPHRAKTPRPSPHPSPRRTLAPAKHARATVTAPPRSVALLPTPAPSLPAPTLPPPTVPPPLSSPAMTPAPRATVVAVPTARTTAHPTAQPPTSPPATATPRPTPSPSPTPRPTASPTPRAAASPTPRPTASPEVAFTPGHAPYELVADVDERAVVPTVSLDKPTPAPVETGTKRDLAYLYQHRYDTPAPDDLQIPGVPVRSQVSSPFDTASGAFHGVRSLNGFSAVRVQVSIPCGARRFVTGDGYSATSGRPAIVDRETGYIYVGGWGAGPRGAPVDAGLQKSSAQSPSDDYAFYWKYAGNRPLTSRMRFPCNGPDVVLELYPVTDNLLVFSATGVNAQGRRVTLTMVQKTRRDDGWTPLGGSKDDGIILKRVVSIAQPQEWRRDPTRRNRYTSGSYFGIDSPQQPKPKIVFRRCDIGRVQPPSIVPQFRPWTDAETWTSQTPGTYLDWPPLGVFRDNANACDSIGIYLRSA